eukprot:7543112-Pyramimonas_sp.AAC.1
MLSMRDGILGGMAHGNAGLLVFSGEDCQKSRSPRNSNSKWPNPTMRTSYHKSCVHQNLEYESGVRSKKLF